MRAYLAVVPVLAAAATLAPAAAAEASPATAAAPVAAAPAPTYVVRAGDTLTSIARRYRVTVAQLRAWNRLGTSSLLRVGQRLAVGAATAPTAARSPYAPGTSISSARAQQVLVADRTSGTYGSFSRYEWRGAATGWVRVGSSAARFGYGGVKPGSLRVAGDGSTPAGTYPMVSAFGVGNPGTKMPYRTVTGCSWWSDKYATYNRFVEQCGHNSGEHLASYTTNSVKQYAQTAVIGFNYFDPRIRSGRGSGDAIFLHYAVGSTAGCVGLTSRTEMNAVVVGVVRVP